MTTHYKNVVRARNKIKSILQSMNSEVDKEYLIFQIKNEFGFSKPAEEFIEELIKFEFVEEKRNKIRWVDNVHE